MLAEAARLEASRSHVYSDIIDYYGILAAIQNSVADKKFECTMAVPDVVAECLITELKTMGYSISGAVAQGYNGEEVVFTVSW